MIVVDTSVWINFLKGARSGTALRIRSGEFVDEIVVGDIVLLEVLQGARDRRHARELESGLRLFRIEAMLDERLARQAADYYRTLRGFGVTVRKTADLIIATFCIDRGYALLHEDRDFTPMAAHLGLKVI
ncbi:MAG TPA: PIN domain-containing protein [Beijerinckiaceae bacterium]|jgi:predicted nucleic acid-binding protein